jgi:anti-sigma-K factor RskA
MIINFPKKPVRRRPFQQEAQAAREAETQLDGGAKTNRSTLDFAAAVARLDLEHNFAVLRSRGQQGDLRARLLAKDLPKIFSPS